MKNLKIECPSCYSELIKLAESVDDFLHKMENAHPETTMVLGLAFSGLMSSFQEYLLENKTEFLEIALSIERTIKPIDDLEKAIFPSAEKYLVKEIAKLKNEDWAETINVEEKLK